MEKETEMTMEKKKNIIIPDDILIVEILSRLPAKSLLRLRWACKYWFDLITRDHDFIKMHLHRYQNINNKSLLLISKTPSRIVSYSVNFCDFINNSSPPKTVQFDYCNLPVWIDHHTIPVEEEEHHHNFLQFKSVGSCNGLIFLYSECGMCHINDYFLWNPSTRELKKLPHKKSNEDLHYAYSSSKRFLGFGYDHTIDDYKVIDIPILYYLLGDENDVVYSEVNINIYTLGSNSWSTKINTDQCDFFAVNNLCPQKNEGCFLKGAFHWITKSAIISFDIVEEEYGQLQPPNYSDGGPILISLEVLNECLCVVNYSFKREVSKSNVELWMMKEYGVNESWTKLFTIDSRKSNNICGFWYLNNLKPIELCKDGGILMVFNEKCLVLYDLKNEKHRWVHWIGDHRIDHIEHAYVESYIESLVSLKSDMFLTATGSTTTVRKQQDIGYWRTSALNCAF